MLSKNLESTLNRALSIAYAHKHEFATYEHLLLALLEDKDTMRVLNHFDVDVMNLSLNLNKYLELELTALVNKNSREARPTSGFQKIVQRAAIHSRATGANIISGSDILAEFFFEKSSEATKLLMEAGLNRTKILDFIHKAREEKSSDEFEITSKLERAVEKTNAQKKEISAASCLESYCVNLNERAKEGLIDMLIGRESEVERTVEILSRRQKNNPLLIGEPGVGKTAIAEGIAYRIVKGKIPDVLKDFEIYSLDIGALVAGTRFRGDFEERIKNLLEEIKLRKNTILFIDEIHTIVGAGSTTTASLDASNLIKPALARGEIRCIGSTTFKEFNQNFAKDSALVRRFQKIVIDEPSTEVALKILKGVQPYYEKHHNVKYSDEAVLAAVTLSDRYIHDRQLPDKAIDLLDEAGAHQKIISNTNETRHINGKDIELIISKILNIPAVTLASDDVAKLKKLEFNLKRVIFGQDKAIEELCDGVVMSKAGLRDFDKPVGSYLFVGPTGTGKTELAKQLAFYCSMELCRFDMSEYMESHSVSRLIGSPPGYAGFDKGGLLTDEVDKAPYSVILFDEIEKAHPEVFNILLQIMDYGKLTDNVGKTVNFSHTIIIMTANSGAEEYTKQRIGFGSEESYGSQEAMKVIEKTFSPEFRERLDKIVMFNPLNDEVVALIIEKTIKELAELLADKKVRLEVDYSAKKYLTENCFGAGKRGGARLLEKIVDDEIKIKVAEEILFGSLQKGGSIAVKADDNQLKFEIQALEMLEA